jgi:hypothetical protein
MKVRLTFSRTVIEHATVHVDSLDAKALVGCLVDHAPVPNHDLWHHVDTSPYYGSVCLHSLMVVKE